MSTSRKAGRVDRQQAYAAARAVQAMARKLRGRKLTSAEARGLTELARRAAGGAARGAKRITSSGRYRRRKGRRSAIRRETRLFVSRATGGKRRKGRSRRSTSGMTRKERRRINRQTYRTQKKRRGGKRRLSRKEFVARRIQTGRDYVAYKKARSATFGPVPFETQPSWLRAKFSKKYRAKRTKWARRRSRG